MESGQFPSTLTSNECCESKEESEGETVPAVVSARNKKSAPKWKIYSLEKDPKEIEVIRYTAERHRPGHSISVF